MRLLISPDAATRLQAAYAPLADAGEGVVLRIRAEGG